MSNHSGAEFAVRSFNTFKTGFGVQEFYRVYQSGDYLLFITYIGRSKWHLLKIQFGLLGALIWLFIRRRIERKRDALLAEMDRMPPNELMARDPRNFAVHRTHLLAQELDQTSFFKRDLSAAEWRLTTPEKGPLVLQLPTPADAHTLLQTMPQFSSQPITIKVVWNEAKKRFLKPS